MTDRIIQVANLDPNKKRRNSNNLRVYWPGGVAACIFAGAGGVETSPAAHNHEDPPGRLRYAIGRTNHGDRYESSGYHANPWFPCIIAHGSGTRPHIIAETGWKPR